MPRITVRLEGVGEVVKNLNLYSQKTREKVKEVVARKSLDVQREAKRICPVDTGTLRNSIYARFYQDGFTGEVGSEIPYSPFVELGTMHQEAQPYLHPALEQETPDYYDRLREALKT